MADKKISQLTELTSGNVANGDYLPIVDVSEATNENKNKRWTWSSIKSDILSWLGFNATEASYLSGVTSAIQTQLDAKAASSHTHTLTDVTDSGALAALDTVDTAQIDDEAVTLAKMAHIATNRVLARSTAGTGDVEALTLPNFRTLINVEDGATADQTGAEIKSLYEAESDTNAFTDADHSKLDGIEAGADVTDATNVDAAGAVMNSDTSTAAMSFVVDEDNMDSNSATKVPTQQSVKAYVDANAGTVDVVSNVAQDRILGRVTTGSGDSEELTAAQVRTLINVEDGADVTDTTNVTAAGALMDSEVSDLAGIKSLNTSTLQAKPAEGAFADGDKTKLDGIETGADVTDTANVTAAGALMDSELADLSAIKTLQAPDNTTISTFGATLIDDASASAARTTLGLGTLADDSAIDVAIGVACSDESTALTTGTAKVTFRMPYAMTLADVRASLTGAGSTSGTTTIDINESGTTILSTKLTIDQGEKTSETAATAAVISDSALADDAEITIDIDAVTGGADETGLKVWLIGTKAVS